MINLLNLPSAGNPFAKAFKKCITVPNEEWVWIGVDYTSLEEGLQACISGDPTKIKALKDGFDLHCMHSTFYYPEIQNILGPDDGTVEWNRKYKSATSDDTRLEAFRQNSKPISFSLSYGAGLTGLFRPVGYKGDTFETTFRFRDYSYTDDLTTKLTNKGREYQTPAPDAIWYPVEEYDHLDTMYHEFFSTAVVPAKQMHFNYHNKLYAGLTEYKHNTIITQAKKYKNVHGMLGLYVNQTTRLSNGASRTLGNFAYQSGSMLTLIAGEKIRRQCVTDGISQHVKPIVSIYDSLYYLVRKDAAIIKQFADLAHPILIDQYLENQAVPLKADLELSVDNWANFVNLSKIDNLTQYLKDN